MLVRLVIYLAIVMILVSGGNMISSRSIRTSVSDKTLLTQTAQLDNALVKYYATHGELPEKLSDDFFELMGLHGFSAESFSYTMKERSFTLKTKYSTGTKESPYSNKTLPSTIDDSTSESG